MCQAWASRSCPLDFHVCLYEVESGSFRIEYLESTVSGSFSPPPKNIISSFQRGRARNRWAPSGRKLPSFPAYPLLCLWPAAQPRRPAETLDKALTLVQSKADTSSTPLWPEYHLLHFSGYFFVITVCLYGAVYRLDCSAPIPRRRPILSLKK